MSTAQLGFLLEQPSLVFNSVRPLSDPEYEQYTKAERLVWDFVADYQQFRMVRGSYAEYKKLVNRFVEQYRLDRRWSNLIAAQINHAINRRLRGFFTEFRFFLDYAERKLKRQYGRQSRQAKEFKAATSEQFDGSFAYRFVSQLRNYGQHVNLPINALSLQSGDFNFLLGTTEDQLLVEVDRDELLKSGFDWRANDVRPQLEALPKRFELDGYIDETMECLEKIHVAFICIVLPEAKQAATYVEQLAQEVGGRGRPCVYLMNTPERPVMGEVYQMTMNASWMPVEVARAITQIPAPNVLSQYRQFTIEMKHAG